VRDGSNVWRRTARNLTLTPNCAYFLCLCLGVHPITLTPIYTDLHRLGSIGASGATLTQLNAPGTILLAEAGRIAFPKAEK